jgi:hypothetical protein
MGHIAQNLINEELYFYGKIINENTVFNPIYLSDRARTDIMFNFLLEQQELNNKILKELEELKNRK